MSNNNQTKHIKNETVDKKTALNESIDLLIEETVIELRYNFENDVQEIEEADSNNKGDLKSFSCELTKLIEKHASYDSESIEMIESENKYMADFLTSLGYNHDQVNEIANSGSLKNNK